MRMQSYSSAKCSIFSPRFLLFFCGLLCCIFAEIGCTELETKPQSNPCDEYGDAFNPAECNELYGELQVYQGTDLIEDQTGSYDFGWLDVGITGSVRSFSIHNSGTYLLELMEENPIRLSGSAASDFLISQPIHKQIAIDGEQSFNAAFAPSTLGIRAATLQLHSTFPNEETYSFDLTGIGMITPDAPEPISTSPTDDASPTWTWDTVEHATLYRWSYDETQWTTQTTTEFTPSADLINGAYILYVQAGCDEYCHWSESGSYSVTIAVTPPPEPEPIDLTFGTDGYTIISNPGNEEGYGIDTDHLNRIYVVGDIAENGQDMVVYRLNEDGSLDPSFNGDGQFTHHNAAGAGAQDIGLDIAVDASAHAYIVGKSDSGGYNFDAVVWKLNSSGNLDASFGSPNGYVTFDNIAGGNHSDTGMEIELDGNGKILMAGTSYDTGSTLDIFICRLDSTGAKDTSFGINGCSILDLDTNDAVHDLKIDASGRILITGEYGTPNDGYVARFDSNGDIDTSFSTDGVYLENQENNANDWEYGKAIAIDSSGTIWWGAYAADGGVNKATVYRITENGQIDTGFGSGNGYMRYVGLSDGTSEELYYLEIDSNGYIWVSGTSYDASSQRSAFFLSLNTDGSLNTNYNEIGYFTHDISLSHQDVPLEFVFDDLGRLAASGYYNNGTDEDYVVWRIVP